MKVTWFGHSCFRLDFDDTRVLIDPFLRGSPTFSSSGIAFEDAIAGATHVTLTHGHDDHVGDAVEICKATGATLVAIFEIVSDLMGQGVAKAEPGNTGGTIDLGSFTLTFVQALHSSGTTREGSSVYLGNPCGLVIRPRSGPVVYHMGDTDIFSDMALINEIYAPEVGIVPIGDRFTMGAKTAALACQKFFSFKTVLPCHYGTFPIIDANADAFVALMKGHNVSVPAVGGSIAV